MQHNEAVFYSRRKKNIQTAEEKECQPLHNKNITLCKQVPQKQYVYTNIYLTPYVNKAYLENINFF